MFGRKPSVSVIMPVYNTEKYLPIAIESILNQTFRDFEFLIFDDGSTDRSVNIIKGFANSDSRIKTFFSKVNKGYVELLNDGIRIAQGKYIARMDSDDVSLPMRLEKQFNLLENKEEVGIVSTSSLKINKNGECFGHYSRINDHQLIHFLSYFNNPLTHPSIMMRKDLITSLNGYDKRKIPAEDYDLWIRALKKTKIVNLSEPLLLYRDHIQSISKVKKEDQDISFFSSQKAHLKELTGFNYPNSILSFLRNSHKKFGISASRTEIENAFESLLCIYQNFLKKERVNWRERKFIKEFIFQKMLSLIFEGFKVNKIFGFRLLFRTISFSFRSFCKSSLQKCLVNFIPRSQKL